jgi:hypothetical protein
VPERALPAAPKSQATRASRSPSSDPSSATADRQAATNTRHAALRKRRRKHRSNQIDYYPLPQDRETVHALVPKVMDEAANAIPVFPDGLEKPPNGKIRKLVGEAFAERLREAHHAQLREARQKEFRNAFRCPHCGGVIDEV